MLTKEEEQGKSQNNSTQKNTSISNNNRSTLAKYAPNPLDDNLRGTSHAPSDHKQINLRGRDRIKFAPTLRSHGHDVDNQKKSKSFPPMKYRSMSCDDARQAVNETLVKVSSMQNLLEKRR